MNIHKNIGKVDYIIRIVILLLFIYLTFKIHWLFILLVLWEIFVLYHHWCFVYDLLNINTLEDKFKKNKSGGKK